MSDEVDPEDELEVDDEPMSPEEQVAHEEWLREAHAELEADATRLFGPPQMRARKNRRYAARLVARHTEPVIRGLLVALSRLKSPPSAQRLSEIDLTTAPLDEIIQPFELYGTRLKVSLKEDGDYVVEIGAGYRTAGAGGEFLVAREGDHFVVKEELSFWRN